MRTTKRRSPPPAAGTPRALSDGEVMGAFVGRQLGAGLVDDRARRARAAVGLDVGAVVAVGDEADLLRVRACRRWPGPGAPARYRAPLRPWSCHPAERSPDRRPRAARPNRKVRLVLVAIEARAAVFCGPPICSGSATSRALVAGLPARRLRSPRAKRTSGAKLEPLIGSARTDWACGPSRCSSRKSSITARRNVLGLVDHVVGKSRAARRSRARVLDVARTAAAAADAGRRARGVVELERHADDLGAGFLQHRRRRRRVDAARHRHRDGAAGVRRPPGRAGP